MIENIETKLAEIMSNLKGKIDNKKLEQIIAELQKVGRLIDRKGTTEPSYTTSKPDERSYALMLMDVVESHSTFHDIPTCPVDNDHKKFGMYVKWSTSHYMDTNIERHLADAISRFRRNAKSRAKDLGADIVFADEKKLDFRGGLVSHRRMSYKGNAEYIVAGECKFYVLKTSLNGD